MLFVSDPSGCLCRTPPEAVKFGGELKWELPQGVNLPFAAVIVHNERLKAF
jgi:hypothetical protein